MKIFKLLLLCSTVAFVCDAQERRNVTDTSLLQPVEVVAVRVSDLTPFAKTTLSKTEIAKNNTGQDLPFILEETPSVVVNSDAGNGIGYTGIRIRGADATRINVTINGIPYNDAESQGTFFVDLPDIASSAGSIQVQRGTGTSTSGSGSFGGAINISTNELNKKGSLEFNNVFGSYHSFKNTLAYSSGIFANHFSIDARMSHLRSDGYIERAASRLHSFFTSLAYTADKNSVRLNIFSGKEKTYQAWYGIDEDMLSKNRRYNSAGTEKPGDPYANETDNYSQTHYQLFYNHKFNSRFYSSVAAFLTRGKGYYEQYKAGELLSGYGLPDVVIDTNTVDQTDLVRRLWLDNYFYGTVFSLHYQRSSTHIIIGGGWNSYDGKHYGTIVSTLVKNAAPQDYRWYFHTAFKKEYSAYGKWTQKLTSHWQTFLDVQLRSVLYHINGFRDNPTLQVKNDYLFFNPKAGITYMKDHLQAYVSFGRCTKEPNRADFEAGIISAPKAETLNDFELGIEKKELKNSWGVNLYYMVYHNQLVLTGKINDVGAYTRTNIPQSYRLGAELQSKHVFNKLISVNGNITVSENKIKKFTEFLDDYDNGGQQTKFYNETVISFSPAITGSCSVNIFPLKNMELNLVGKYVSRQYLDNTSHKSRSLNPYFVADTRLGYVVKNKNFTLEFFGKINNFFSKKYEPNGYTFSYYYGGNLTTENYYFPMATRNISIGINIAL